jgi:hypothetical protein
MPFSVLGKAQDWESAIDTVVEHMAPATAPPPNKQAKGLDDQSRNSCPEAPASPTTALDISSGFSQTVRGRGCLSVDDRPGEFELQIKPDSESHHSE